MPLTRARLVQTVEVLLHQAMTAELQLRVEALLSDPNHDELALRRLHCRSIRWAHVKNAHHHFYILASLRWNDGSTTELRWRVPNTRYDGSVRSAKSPPIKQVPLDKWSVNSYPPGARAGFGRTEGRMLQNPPARRTKNGRAIAAYRRSRRRFGT